MDLLKHFTKDKTKTVYRFVSSRELELLQNGETQGFGLEHDRIKEMNNHKYDKDEKYFHLFDSKDIPPHVVRSLPGNKEFVCSFEIEKSVLNQHKGTGYYPAQGYDFDFLALKEYAIPMSEYNPDWFTGSTPLESNYIQTNNDFVPENFPEQ
ncbi:MAG: hypothetical protein IKA31_00690 [Clostridia bacterium]|nr:hypothetical protein [Clostridia bacterium]